MQVNFQYATLDCQITKLDTRIPKKLNDFAYMPPDNVQCNECNIIDETTACTIAF